MDNENAKPAIFAMFPSDDHSIAISSLHKEATILKKSGDWHEAIERLKLAKEHMLVSVVHYPHLTWCRLPTFLQYAGRYAEAVLEFDFLLDDLDRRCKKQNFVDNASVGSSKSEKVKNAKEAKKVATEVINRERDRVEKREVKALEKLEKVSSK